MKSLFYIAAFLTTSILHGQYYLYEYFTEKDGLSGSHVYKVIQDRNGYLWFATSSGVTCYDGISFREYSTADGLTDYDVLSLYEDRKGRIWFETFNGKPCFYFQGKIYNPENHALLLQIKPANYIKSIYEDDDGHIWMSFGYLCYKIDFKNNRVTQYNQRAAFFTKNDKNELLIYSGYNYYYNTVSGKKEFIPEYYSGVLENVIGAYRILKNGNILYSKRNKLFMKYKNADEIIPVASANFLKEEQQIINIFEDEDENIYMATTDGMVSFPGNAWEHLQQVHEHILKGKNTTSVAKDHQGNIWITTTDGVYKINRHQFKRFQDFGSTVVTFEHNEDYILVAFANKRILLLNKEDLSIVNEYFVDVEPRKIVAYKQFFYLITNSGNFEIGKDHYRSIFKLMSLKDLLIKNDTYIAGGPSGLHIIPEAFDSFPEFRYSDHQGEDSIKNPVKARVFSLKDADTVVYVSAKDGLYKTKGENYSPFLRDSESYKHRVLHFNHFRDFLVLGTEGNGVYLYENEVLKKHFTAKNGLHSNEVKNTFVYEDTLYVVTKKGVQFLNEDLEIGEVTPVSNNNFHINKAAVINDRLTLATSEGLLILNIKNTAVIKNDIKSEIKAYRTDIFFSQDTLLPYSKEPIEFRFKIFDYTKNEIQYQYRIREIEKDWSTTRSNTIAYQNLSPGIYHFDLGYHGNIIDSFSFTIKTPFWLQWWFYVLIVVISCFLIYKAYRYLLSKKVKETAKKHEISLMLASAEQDALRAQMNPHFIFNALNAIQNLILKNKTENAYKYLGNFSKLVRIILNNSRNIITTVESEVRFLSLYLELESLRFGRKLNYKIIVDTAFNSNQNIPSMVIQPLVENAIIHGLLPLSEKDDPALSITFTDDDDFIRCIVNDNGVGRKKIAAKKPEKSLGLQIIKERLFLYDNQGLSSITLVDKEQGTKAILKIKK